MSTLSRELDQYLTIRRSLGYDLRTTERVLRRFIAFAEREDAAYISTPLFLRWQEACGQANRQTWSRRLGMIRLFAQWLHGIDPRHKVPSRALIPSRYRRAQPYIYSDEDLQRMLDAAAALPSIYGIRALPYSTLFGLIAVTGLRVSEALSLNVGDVDLDRGAGDTTTREAWKGPDAATLREHNSGTGGTSMTHATLPSLIQTFFTDRLCIQMEASPNTTASYRDTMRLLLRFASERTGRAPTNLRIEELDAGLVGDFLAYVESVPQQRPQSRYPSGRYPLFLPVRGDARAGLPAPLPENPRHAGQAICAADTMAAR